MLSMAIGTTRFVHARPSRECSSRPFEGPNLPVSDSEVTVAFFNDGTMQSINGRLVDVATPFERPVGVDAAAEVFQAEGLIHGPATLLFDGEQWQSPDGSLEEVYSDLMGAAAWLLRTQNGEFILDQETRMVELVGTPIDSVRALEWAT